MGSRSRASWRTAGWLAIALVVIAGTPIAGTVIASGSSAARHRTSGAAAFADLRLPTNDAFRPTPCPLGDPVELVTQGVACGVLRVPERHANPRGPSIELAVAVVAAKHSGSAGEPVVYLEGGPGGGALVGLGFWIGTSLRDDHDIVVFDQRGTGFSKPSLACRELSLAADEHWSNQEALDEYRSGVRDCRARLTSEGIDLGAYTTNENAADVESLRVALGIDRWGLYGISYGTRLALEVMRDYPAGVTSAVLDSAYPPQVRAFEDHGARLDRAFDALIQACAADPACAAEYPGLGQSFGPAMDTLEAHVGRPVDEVSGHAIEAALRGWLYDTRLIGILPALIHSAEIGNTGPFLPPSEAHPVDPLVDSIGMNLSVECAERGSRADPAAVAADAAAHGRWRVLLERDWTPAACAIWDVPPARGEDLEPVLSSIPTLVFAGNLDPVTPPSYGALTASTLDHAQLIEVPRFGHGVTMTRCPSDIRDAFFANPEQPLDRSCIATLAGQAGVFVTDRVANAGLGRMYTRLLFGLNPPTLGDRLIAGYVFGTFGITLVAWLVLAARTVRRHRRRRGTAEVLASAAESVTEPVTEPATPHPVGPQPATSGTIRIARLLGLGAIVADLAFVVALAIVLANEPDPFLRALGLPAGAAWIIGVAVVGGVLALGLSVTAVIAVWRRNGRRRTRVHLVALAVACLVASGALRYYGLF